MAQKIRYNRLDGKQIHLHLQGAAMKFIIEQSDEYLTPVAGLALVGEIINHTALKFRLNKMNTWCYLAGYFPWGCHHLLYRPALSGVK